MGAKDTTLKERRTFRLTCEAPVLIKLSRDPDERVWAYLAGVTADVSMEGAALVLPEAIPPGSSIEVAFLPTSDQPLCDREIRKTATVVWVGQLSPLPSAPFRHGVRFTEPDPELLFWAWPGESISS